MRALLLTVAMCSVGCSMGFGSPYVGQWRARDEVVFKACREDGGGRCVEEKEYVRHVPARSFNGVIIPYAAMGASWATHNGATNPRFRLESSFEYLQGRGRLAWGVRVGGVLDGPRTVLVPAMLVGHFSLTERLGLYGAGGAIPFSRFGRESGALGARGLLGFQWALARVHNETYWLLSFEADTMWVKFADAYRSTGITGHIGVFF